MIFGHVRPDSGNFWEGHQPLIKCVTSSKQRASTAASADVPSSVPGIETAIARGLKRKPFIPWLLPVLSCPGQSATPTSHRQCTASLLQRPSFAPAFITSGGRSVSLILMPPRRASFGPKSESTADCVTLYRHKRSTFSKFLYLLGIWTINEGAAERFREQFLKNRRLSQIGVFKKWYSQLIHRSFLLSFHRGEREMSFAKPPEFSLLWADSGNSVAVLLNGEPWAFVYEEKNHGYSKGILNPEHGNVWDQELFEKIFPR